MEPRKGILAVQMFNKFVICTNHCKFVEINNSLSIQNLQFAQTNDYLLKQIRGACIYI